MMCNVQTHIYTSGDIRIKLNTSAMLRIQTGLDQILGNRLPGKIWSNPSCCHFLLLWLCIQFSLAFGSKPQAKERIGPNFGGQLVRQNLVQSSLLLFPAPGAVYPVLCSFWLQATSKGKDWTKFWGTACSAKFGPILLVVISFPYPYMTKIPITARRQNLVQSCGCVFMSLYPLVPSPKQRTGLDQILGDSLFGKIWSNPPCCHFLLLGLCIQFSLACGSKPQAKERIGPSFGGQLVRQNLVQSSLLSLPVPSHQNFR